MDQKIYLWILLEFWKKDIKFCKSRWCVFGPSKQRPSYASTLRRTSREKEGAGLIVIYLGDTWHSSTSYLRFNTKKKGHYLGHKTPTLTTPNKTGCETDQESEARSKCQQGMILNFAILLSYKYIKNYGRYVYIIRTKDWTCNFFLKKCSFGSFTERTNMWNS